MQHFKIVTAVISLLGGSFVSAADIDVFIASGDRGIYSSQLDTQSGALAPPKHVADFSKGGFLKIHPNHKVLYATGDVSKKSGGVLAFTINSGVKLTEINRQSAQGKRLCHISLDSTSHVLMAANYGDGNVVSFPVTNDGRIGDLISLQQHSGSSINKKRQNGPHAHSIYPGPDNRFAYAPDLGIDKVMIYTIDHQTAKLTPAGFVSLPEGAGPRHMKFGKNGKQAYVLNELTVDISIFDRNSSTGQLTPTKKISTLPEDVDKTDMTCSEIRVSPDGAFIYCANRDLSKQGRDSLSVFKVEKNGDLSRIQTIGAEVWIPRNINLDPSGQWLLVAGQKSNNVPVFKIDRRSGKLSFTGHQISIPTAMCIEFKNSSTAQ